PVLGLGVGDGHVDLEELVAQAETEAVPGPAVAGHVGVGAGDVEAALGVGGDRAGRRGAVAPVNGCGEVGGGGGGSGGGERGHNAGERLAAGRLNVLAVRGDVRRRGGHARQAQRRGGGGGRGVGNGRGHDEELVAENAEEVAERERPVRRTG